MAVRIDLSFVSCQVRPRRPKSNTDLGYRPKAVGFFLRAIRGAARKFGVGAFEVGHDPIIGGIEFGGNLSVSDRISYMLTTQKLFLAVLSLASYLACSSQGSELYTFEYTAVSGPVESFSFSFTAPTFVTVGLSPPFAPFTVTDGANKWPRRRIWLS